MTTTVVEQEPDWQPAPQPPPAAPPQRPRPSDRARRALCALRTVVVTLALLAAAVCGGSYLVRERLAARAYVDLGTAVLTAEPVPVGSPTAAVVTGVSVAASSRVSAGQALAVLTLPPASAGQPVVRLTLSAPVAGSVAAVDVQLGGVVRAGEPVVTLYDQSRLTFQAQVPVERIKRLRLGMVASLTGPGVHGHIRATLARVVPRVGDGTLADTDRLAVVLVPLPGAKATVATLVPGLPYTATVDTRTSSAGIPAVNSAG